MLLLQYYSPVTIKVQLMSIDLKVLSMFKYQTKTNKIDCYLQLRKMISLQMTKTKNQRMKPHEHQILKIERYKLNEI